MNAKRLLWAARPSSLLTCAPADDIQDRVLGCYIDYNTLQIFNPKQTTVQDTFFYNGHSVLHGSAMRGLIYRDNTCALPIGLEAPFLSAMSLFRTLTLRARVRLVL